MNKKLMMQALSALLSAEDEMNCEYGVTELLRQAIAEAEKPEPDDLTTAYMTGLYDGKKQAKQEQGGPVAWWNGEEGVVFAHDQICIPNWTDHYYIPLYTKPQTKEWVGLTADELNAISDSMRTWNSFQITDVYFAIEAQLKDKNA